MNLYESINKGFEAKYGKIEEAQISKQAPKSRKVAKKVVNENRESAKSKILLEVKDEFEAGTSPIEDFEEFRAIFEDNGVDVESSDYDFYLDLINMGPEGFYEEYKDRLDFDPDFAVEYGCEDFDESCKPPKSYYAQESLAARPVREAREDHFPIKKYLADNKDEVDQIVSSAQTRGWRAANQALIDFIKEAPEIPEGQKKSFEAKMSAIRNATGFFSAVATYMTAIKVDAGAKVKAESCDKKLVSRKAVKESLRSRKAMKETLAKKKALKECDCPDCQCDGACTCTEERDCCGGEAKSRRAAKRHIVKEDLADDNIKNLNQAKQLIKDYLATGEHAKDNLEAEFWDAPSKKPDECLVMLKVRDTQPAMKESRNGKKTEIDFFRDDFDTLLTKKKVPHTLWVDGGNYLHLSGEDDKDLHEGMIKEDLGQDIDQYQKWVDYDMKKYGRISDITNRELKKAGLKVVKDKYGDYEVMV